MAMAVQESKELRTSIIKLLHYCLWKTYATIVTKITLHLRTYNQ